MKDLRPPLPLRQRTEATSLSEKLLTRIYLPPKMLMQQLSKEIRRLMLNLYRIFIVSLMRQKGLSEALEARITVCRIHSDPMTCHLNLIKLGKV